MPADPLGQHRHQAGPDDRRVRLDEPARDRPDRRLGDAGAVVQVCPGRWRRDQLRRGVPTDPARHRVRGIATVATLVAGPSRSGPHQTPHSTQVAVHADPLGLTAWTAGRCGRSRARPWPRSPARGRPARSPRTTAETTAAGRAGAGRRAVGSDRRSSRGRAGCRCAVPPPVRRGHVTQLGADRRALGPLPWPTGPTAAAGSRSTACTASPRSSQGEGVRSRTAPEVGDLLRCPPRTNRSACSRLTSGRVACSSPSAVHHRGGPGNRTAARVRSRAWLAAAATTSGRSRHTGSRRHRLEPLQRGACVVRREPLDQRPPLRRQQRLQRGD